MDPDDVIRQFERLALDEEVELPVDDAIAGLAVLLADPAIEGSRGCRCGADALPVRVERARDGEAIEACINDDITTTRPPSSTRK